MVVFDYRQKEFLNILLNTNAPVSISSLQVQMNISKRTIYYIVNKLNDTLYHCSLDPIQNIRKQGYFIKEEQKEKIHELICEEASDEVMKPKERVYYLICWLLYPQSPVHVESIMDEMEISRNSVFNDLKQVKEELESYDLCLEFDIKRGYSINGKTLSKRTVLLYYLRLLLNRIHYKSLHFLNSSDVEDFYNRLIKISLEMNNEYDFEMLLSIACLLCIIRNVKEQFEFSLLELKDLGKTSELRLIDIYFQDFNVHERLYLAVHLLGSKAGSTLKVKDDESDIQLFELAQHLCDVFERLAYIQLVDKNGLINSLYIHFKLTMYYYRLSIQVVNPLIEEVKENYSDLYQLVSEICKDLSSEFPFPVLDSEIVYITMHFGGHLRQGSGKFYRKIRVLVVCPSGISTSTLLKREVEQLYSNVTVVATAAASNIDEYEEDIDFIVSTIDIQCEMPWIKVHTILTNEDKSRIASLMMLNVDTYKADGEHINGLFQLLERYVPQEKMEALKQDVYQYLKEGNVLVEIEKKGPTQAFDLLKPENIQILNEEKSWEEAIKVASKPLLQKKVIKEKYIIAMIELLKEYGPYIVLRNKVAIAHAAPSQGANILGLSLLISKRTISFEGEEVKYLFILSNPEQDKHLHLLRGIMNMSSDPALLSELDQMQDTQEIYKRLSQATYRIPKNSKSN
ncbi:BglG family transcription antiterminator [Amedibacillus dolichus]|uniref:PRD domain protein n=1 Tax=Amedibacillus dolichus DSM 3991 TaxID=428127 RepID=A8RAP2_9FIRM|nr:BglG family transcription antiterminator [Amedibacillus dolichus]EDP11690.1 PRD domain protein [Amedibacillus dolichus DSM 3991]